MAQPLEIAFFSIALHRKLSHHSENRRNNFYDLYYPRGKNYSFSPGYFGPGIFECYSAVKYEMLFGAVFI